MPQSKTRAKPKKRKLKLSPTEIIKAEIDQAVCDSYANNPKDSLALEIAKQNSALREHLRNPREFLEICAEIKHSPVINTFEQYGIMLYRSRLMSPHQAEQIAYRLQAFQAIETWKRTAQTYIFSPELLDKLLTNPTPIICDAAKIILPFRSFYVDLGTFSGEDKHIGFFVNQRSDEPCIDFVFIKGEFICSIMLNKVIQVSLPESTQTRDLNDVRYLNFVIAAVLTFLSMNEQGMDAQFIEVGQFSHEHNEWRTYVTLPDESQNHNQPEPHWVKRIDGGITWQSV